jgi:hypothetical protein
MHGISARRVVESKREFRSAEHRMRGGAVVPVTIKTQAQIAALDILSRLIAQMLAASSALETSDE